MEDYVVIYYLAAIAILRVDTMPMGTVRPFPTVVVDDISVKLRVWACHPGRESCREVVDHIIDNLDIRREHVEPSRLCDVGGVGSALPGLAAWVRAHQLQIAIYNPAAGNLDSAFDRHTVVSHGPNRNRAIGFSLKRAFVEGFPGIPPTG